MKRGCGVTSQTGGEGSHKAALIGNLCCEFFAEKKLYIIRSSGKKIFSR